MTNKAKKGNGEKMAEEILNSGKAYKKFIEIIKAQKGSIKHLKFGKFRKDILTKSNGKITEINNIKINLLARVAGCPMDKSSGLYIYHHVGDKLKKGDKIITLYAESKPRLQEALKYYNKEKPVQISK
jgi:AMP phosphorylase